MNPKKLRIIVDLINNAYARARNDFIAKNQEGYQNQAQ